MLKNSLLEKVSINDSLRPVLTVKLYIGKVKSNLGVKIL
jgi:hypothetical protein